MSFTKSLRIVLTGFFGAGNLGDEAILLAEVRGFSVRRPGSVFTIASFTPEQHRALGLEAFHARDRVALRQAVAEADLLMAGGGGLWQDYWGWKPEDLFAPEPFDIAFYARGPLAAAMADVPFVMFANGVGPLHSPDARRSVAALAKLAAAVSVRDRESAELLRSGGYGGPLTLAADPAFAIVPVTDTVTPKQRPVRIGVVPRLWSLGADADQLLRTLGEAVGSVAREREAEIIFLPYQRPSGGTSEDDAAAIERVAAALMLEPDDVRVIAPATPEEAAGWLGSCDVAVTMRLHGAILAAVAGTPSVAIAVDPKITANARRLGLSDLVVPLASCSRAQIKQCLTQALNTREPLQAVLEAGVDTARQLLDAAFENTLRSLERPLGKRAFSKLVPRTAPHYCLALRLPTSREEARRILLNASSWPVNLTVAVADLPLYAALQDDSPLPGIMIVAAQGDSFGDFLQSAAQTIAEYAPAAADVMVLDVTRFDPAAAFAAFETNGVRNAALIAAPGPLDAEAAPTGAVHPDLGAAWIRRDLWNEAVPTLIGLESAAGCGAELARQARRKWDLVGALPLAPTRTDSLALECDLARAESFNPTYNRYYMPRPALRLADEITEWVAGRQVVIFPPTVGWTVPLAQRTNHMARALAAAGHAVLYSVERSVADAGSLQEVAPGVMTIAHPFSSLAFLDQPIVLLYSYNTECAAYFRHPRTIYEWIDDLSIFAGDQNDLRRAHQLALERAEITTATAAALWREAVASRPDTLYLPNAVHVADFDPRTAPETPLEAADQTWFEADERPVMIYWGAVAPWFDDRLLAEVARRRPDLRIAVLGPGYERELVPLQAAAPENLRYFGPRPYHALASYARRAAVAILPFRAGPITLATSPLKLFEYLAARLPVVSTLLPESAALDQVLLADDAASFVQALDQALVRRQEPEFHAWLDRIVPLHDWSARAAALRAALKLEGAVAPAPLPVPNELQAGREHAQAASMIGSELLVDLLSVRLAGEQQAQQELKTQLLEKERLLAQQEEAAQRMAAQLRMQQTIIAARDEGIAWLQEELAQLRAAMAAREQKEQALTTRLATQAQAVRTLEAQMAASQAQMAASQAQLRAYDAQLTAINQSSGWRLLQLLWRLRRWVAPQNSAREQEATSPTPLPAPDTRTSVALSGAEITAAPQPAPTANPASTTLLPTTQIDAPTTRRPEPHEEIKAQSG